MVINHILTSRRQMVSRELIIERTHRSYDVITRCLRLSHDVITRCLKLERKISHTTQCKRNLHQSLKIRRPHARRYSLDDCWIQTDIKLVRSRDYQTSVATSLNWDHTINWSDWAACWWSWPASEDSRTRTTASLEVIRSRAKVNELWSNELSHRQFLSAKNACLLCRALP